MATTQQYQCLCCKQPFVARTADRKRGWARYCSKSCKAIKQEQRTGQFKALQTACDNHYSHDGDYADIDWEDPSWDAHKDVF